MVRLRKDDALFLMIDVQAKLLPAIDGAEKILLGCERLLKAAEILKIPFAYTEQYPKGIGATVEPLLKVLPAGCAKYEKTAFSCCDEAGFVRDFDMKDRSVIVIFGIESHICVLSTVIDFLAQGKKVAVAADACGSRDQKNHALALDEARAHGASVLPTETVIYQMIGAAGTPEFKALLPLFK